MENKEKRLSFQLLILIASHKLAPDATEFFRSEALPMQYRMNAQGTASGEILDMLGLGGVDKCVLISMIHESAAKSILKKMNLVLGLDSANSGIAFTIPLTGANSRLLQVISGTAEENFDVNEKKGKMSMNEAKHVVIAAIVNRGFSGNVMDAARAGGARGGTVMQSRRIRETEAAGCWGLGPEDEKEIVLILADEEDKVNIMREISCHCGVNTEARGAVISLPVDHVVGLSVDQ